MREIKFKAWNEQNGLMDVVELNFRSAPDVLCRFDYDNDGYQEARFTNNEQAAKDSGKKACILLQFTGLTDKNGKEIWEGDLLRVDLEKFGVQDKVYQVIWEDDGWALKDLSDPTLPAYIFHDEDRQEVISNIWENPELLKSN